MFWINNSHGLELEPISSSWQRRGNENGILFLAVLYSLKILKQKLTLEDKHCFKNIVQALHTWKSHSRGIIIPGLYDRGAFESYVDHEFFIPAISRRLISHDNLTAISELSAYLELPYAKDIAQYGLKNLFRFDNNCPEKPRWWFRKQNGQLGSSFKFHPRDWFLWLYNAGGKYRALSYFFYSVFFLANVITCCTDYQETSGKQLMFMRLAIGSKKSWLKQFNFWICKKLMKRKYGKHWLEKIFEIYYYQREDNPIRVLSRGLEI